MCGYPPWHIVYCFALPIGIGQRALPCFFRHLLFIIVIITYSRPSGSDSGKSCPVALLMTPDRDKRTFLSAGNLIPSLRPHKSLHSPSAPTFSSHSIVPAPPIYSRATADSPSDTRQQVAELPSCENSFGVDSSEPLERAER